MATILLTGGAGYIGSHTVVELVGRGYEVLLLDNFSNSSPRVLDRLQQITGRHIPCVNADIRDATALDAVFNRHVIDAVIHLAAFKAVGESCARPLLYFDNNIAGTIALLRAMQRHRIGRLIFSSSATVYGQPDACPIPEDAPLRATNPYGRSKLVVEQLIGDLTASDSSFHTATLRYFNPVGAHESGLLGEDPRGVPHGLMPFVCQVAVGREARLNIFGNDYPTVDGSGVRDYLHVVDLARAHVRALAYLQQEERSLLVNLGVGRGVSVLQLVRAFELASGRSIPLHFAPRRPGDVAECYADPTLAEHLLGWRAEYDLQRMCADAWRWQQQNPCGYDIEPISSGQTGDFL